MNDDELEGSLVLEKLAEHGLVEDFYEAIDEDNLPRAISLMRQAHIDEDTIHKTIKAINA